MVIGIFGESCTGKSTLAERLKANLEAKVFTGKDYLRLAKHEAEARQTFEKLLNGAMCGAHILYVISERQHLSLLPRDSIRVLVTAELETIKTRFASRMGGNLPAPVSAMLERNHGCFDQEPHHIHVRSGESDLDTVCREIEAYLK